MALMPLSRANGENAASIWYPGAGIKRSLRTHDQKGDLEGRRQKGVLLKRHTDCALSATPAGLLLTGACRFTSSGHSGRRLQIELFRTFREYFL